MPNELKQRRCVQTPWPSSLRVTWKSCAACLGVKSTTSRERTAIAHMGWQVGYILLAVQKLLDLESWPWIVGAYAGAAWPDRKLR